MMRVRECGLEVRGVIEKMLMALITHFLVILSQEKMLLALITHFLV